MTTEWLLGLAMLALLAAAMCGWMWWRSRGISTLPGCGPQSGCGAVLASRWSRWLGIRVAVPAGATYLLLAAAALGAACADSALLRRTASTAAVGLSLLAVASALWFVGLQLFVVRRWCAYCLTIHAIGVVTCAIVLGHLAPAGTAFLRSTTSLVIAGIPLFLLICGQLLVQPERFALDVTSEAAPESRSDTGVLTAPAGLAATTPSGRIATFMSGRISLVVDDWPLLGDPAAPSVIAYLFDYTCPTCRKGHRSLTDALQQLGANVAVLLVPAPVDPTGNPHVTRQLATHAFACRFARLGLDVWRHSPAAFGAFDQWVFESDEPPAIGLAVAHARRLTGANDIDPSIPDPELDALINTGVATYRDSQTERMPTLLFRDAILRGKLPPAPELARIMTEQAAPTGALSSVAQAHQY